ncbi:adenine phosphoribosyltransferase [Demequina sp. NBRC 110056]|uniref:adenine phosphoribosyltransferase n=1 Tax=Demequina sp. NBRC 110056 TaxID=1570345 RepID=UPI0009FCB62A|nr:adenine phosphoribosyltransferase [Demequina sp. NBRC 110056]
MITLDDFATYPDFPVPGILFYDISPILADPSKFATACAALMPAEPVDIVVGVDARGFIFAPVVAQRLDVGMSMVRKKGKMPGELLESSTEIEYGASDLVLSPAGIERKRVLVIDDVLATGGTASAVAEMLGRAGAADVQFGFLLELEGLGGREALAGHGVHSVVRVPPID